MINRLRSNPLALDHPDKDPGAEPLRPELFSIDQLKRHAVRLAGQQKIDPGTGPDKLLPRLAENERILLDAYDGVTAAAQMSQRIVPAEVWLLDNFYLIEQQIRLARRHLPRGYSRQLPRLAQGPLAGYPRVYELALELSSHQDGRLDADNATDFIAAYQDVEPLKLGELWAFPIMLRLALLENLCLVGLRILRRREERDVAIDWANRMLEVAERQPRQLVTVLAEFAGTDTAIPLTAPFVEEFQSRLQPQQPAMKFAHTWLEHQLSEQGVTPAQLLQAASRAEAANQLSIANSTTSLRFISALDWREFVEALSVVERILRTDPAGAHAGQDFATRDHYRHVIEDIARQESRSESDVAHSAIALSAAARAQSGADARTAHVGFYLIGRGKDLLKRKIRARHSWRARILPIARATRLPIYLTAVGMLTALAVFGALTAGTNIEPSDWRYWFLATTGVIAASSLAVSLVNRLAALTVQPCLLPRCDFSNGIPIDHRTMVVVPTLLSSPSGVADLLEALETRYLGNRDRNLFFALLTDFMDASEQNISGDDELLALTREGILTLNETYGEDRNCIFYLFHRPRVWNPTERLWMGYERKRGKLEAFNALLREGAQGPAHTAFCSTLGDLTLLGSIRYVITLDTDTQLPRDSAYALVGNMAHPLNRPRYDAVAGRVVEGHAVLQPITSISLSSAGKSRFARLYSGEPGIDPYTREVSDLYQDLFGEGSFIGKGIYDVETFRQAVDGRFPENLILSHDLLEGGYACSALVTDVALIEDHPASYVTDASRRHRWIRGDWQLAGWLLPWVSGPENRRQRNPLSALSRWKILDNLRRSVAPAALLALVIGGWAFGAGPAWLWILFAATVPLVPVLVGAIIDLGGKPLDRDWRTHLILTTRATGRPVMLALLSLIFLPYEALLSLDAIARSALRRPFTRRGLLLWQTPSSEKRNARRSLAEFNAEMYVSPVLASVLAVALTAIRPTEWMIWAPVLAAWLSAPTVAWFISKPQRLREPELSESQRKFLRMLARRTWRYFAEFVGPSDNWLPPDNFQEHPAPSVASRTSPTNIGMALLANLAAYDLGYITAGELLKRTEATFDAMETLERYRGHFYNWYDTQTMQPLHPRYVSSVDSGNLLGSLVTLRAGLAELKSRPVLPSEAFAGLKDTLAALAVYLPSPTPAIVTERIKRLSGILDSSASGPGAQGMIDSRTVMTSLQSVVTELFSALVMDPAALEADTGTELIYWTRAFDAQLRAIQEDHDQLLPDPQRFDHIPTLEEVAGSTRATRGAIERIGLIDTLISRCREFAEMDFMFLYDSSSCLLSIGYDVGERRRDPAYYDLLASEARLASFMLIAQGQVPQKHWFALGRALTSHGGNVTLISWSGSMFEYLMPHLIMPSHNSTLLDETCKAAVSRQIEYGRQRGVPWGISESCYGGMDAHQVYQYRAFGVPGLGFKRGLGDDLVVAPYATALALTVKPQAATRNLQRLSESGFLGRYGLYEAIDYTPSRVPPRLEHAIVRTFMAHHQGMSLLAFDHALCDQPMQRRFTSDPLVRATELLLQERVPKRGSTLHPHAAEVSAVARPPVADAGDITRTFPDPNTPLPETHLLSNGKYHVMATNAGGGYSRWRDVSLTRWREDATSDCWGTFIYLHDLGNGATWSSAHQPTLRKADRYEAIFVQSRAEYRRLDEGIDTHTEIIVSPEDDVEIRRVTLTNLSSGPRRIEITSYAEVVLAPLNADLAHRTFSNLFVQTEILPDRQAILCVRRSRAPDEKTPWMFHLVTALDGTAGDATYETDRSRFIGRGRTPADPAALADLGGRRELSNTSGPVLDPIVAIRRTIALRRDEGATVKVISGIADTREAALALVDKYGDRHFVERAFEMAWFQSQELLHQIGATEPEMQLYGQLASSMIHASALRRAPSDLIARNRVGQAGLWRFALSGDLPIILVRIGDRNRIDIVRHAMQAHAYWRMKGLSSDLVILNEDYSGYRTVLHDEIIDLINTGPDAEFLDKPGGVFVRRTDELSEEDRVLLQSVARVVLTDTAGTLVEQINRRALAERLPKRLVPTLPAPEPENAPLPPRELNFFNGLGGFTPNGHEYVVMLEPGENCPAPWVNVIASPYIGTVVSEAGSAYTWVDNAHEFRLTTWHNDPLSDTTGEAFYIRDNETGAFWSPSPLPARGRSGYVCRHGYGYSVFEHDEDDITSELSFYVAMDAPVKFAVLKLRNASGRRRRLSATGYWELVLGEWRHQNLMHVVTEVDTNSGALLARNPYGRIFSDRLLFAQCSEPARTVTGSRTEFIGRNGSLNSPAALHRTRLSGKIGAALDPCAAIQAEIALEDGEEREIVFVIGAARSTDEVHHFLQRFARPVGARHALEAVRNHWDHVLGAVQVETPDKALDVLTNGWLIYQTLSSRVWGRSGYYQSGGAYGFRDQLQDTLALTHAAPWLIREQLIRCAERQFRPGDVQHWWHPPSGHGVRTRFSDDYLWLPYAVCRYVSTTGDTGVLEEQVPFLEGRDLNAQEEAYYDLPQRSNESASLYEHCVRAIRYGLKFGEHGLPLMGCGDWNDGMNRVGWQGRGESVWLAWFLYDNLLQFGDLARLRADPEVAELCADHARRLLENIEMHGWDGNWYRRAYFDDGTPLGSSGNDECQIDSISQSWAVLSGGGDTIRAQRAMSAVDQRLVKRDTGLIALLDPPFDVSTLDPGYIKGYVPGVRENGGQYTHAAIWATMAFAKLDDRPRAWELFNLLNPIHHGSTPDRINTYKVEPYVMAADIYSSAPHAGRGGWTWYTGAAGWMYRLSVETLLGIELNVDELRLSPRIPDDWNAYKVHYRYRETFYHIAVRRIGECPSRVQRVTVDGNVQAGGAIALVDDRVEHDVEVELG